MIGNLNKRSEQAKKANEREGQQQRSKRQQQQAHEATNDNSHTQNEQQKPTPEAAQQPQRRPSSNDDDDDQPSQPQPAPSLSPSPPPPPPPPPLPGGAVFRRPRPAALRPQRVVIAPTSALRADVSGAPIAAQIELANVLAPGRASMMPPKRPAHLPARLHAAHLAGSGGGNVSGATGGAAGSIGFPAASAGSLSGKPNRYSWAQMQHWQAAAAEARLHSMGVGAGQASGDPMAPPGAGGHHRHHNLHQKQQSGGFHYFAGPFSSAASRVLVVNPIVNLSEHTKSRLVKFIEAVKHFSEKWFSHVLLLLFLAVYACFGAYIFISFEAPNEQWEKQLIIDTRLRIVNESWAEARATESQAEYVELFGGRFEEYERLLNRVCASGITSSSLENQWTFWGALFYSMTVFTTIGYGHLTPVTFAGRVATMVYAIFGIPILLMVLADLGKLLTRIIKFAFKRFRQLYNKLWRRKASMRTRKLISESRSQYMGVAREALTRGYTTYIQPYYQHTIPRRLLRFGRTGEHEGGETIAGGRIVGPDEEASEQRFESSDVIVTPGRQTKPVSPVASPTDKRSPLADVHAHAHAHAHGHHHQHQPYHGHAHTHGHKDKAGRAHSPGNLNRRKVSSASSRPIELKGPSSNKSAAKSSVSRSSSSSNVAPPVVNCEKQRRETSTTAPAGQEACGNNLLPQANEEVNLESPTTSEHQSDTIYGADIEMVAGDEEADELGAPPIGHDEMMSEGVQEEEEEEEEEDFDIPVSFALFLLITYMMFGAVVFSIWEGWNFFDALYFVFISMSTIGFGDLVPQHPKRMIGTFAYLLFGLALTSMCINVVQEKIHATFLRAKMQIGEKMGFDLDQIMADDYYDLNYDDETSANGGQHGETGGNGERCYDDLEFNKSSTCVSQTNSCHLASDRAGGSGSGWPQGASLDNDPQHHPQQQVSVGSGGGQQQQDSGGASNKSQGNNGSTKQATRADLSSGRWKKRGNVGPQDSLGGGGGAQLSAASSMRRKGSSRRLVRQATPCSNQTSSTNKPAESQQQQPQTQTQMQSQLAQDTKTQPQPASSGAVGELASSPLRHLFEIVRSDAQQPVQVRGAQESLPDGEEKQQQQQQQQPGINQPIESVKAFCEPLRRAFQTGEQQDTRSHPKLGASRSQPNSPVAARSLDSHASAAAAHPQQQMTAAAAAAAAVSPMRGLGESNSDGRQHIPLRKHSDDAEMVRAASRAGRPHQSQSKLGRGASSRRRTGGGASEGSSPRRASVSDELNQLDDLIVALSRSPPERYGPLLGIPASARPARSVSPAAAATFSSTRRGTSMVCRPNGRTGAGTTSLGATLQKKRSLASQMALQRPLLGGIQHQLSPEDAKSTGQINASSNHKHLQTNHSGGQQQQQQQSRLSAQTRPLNLSESQAALDELEAIKFSAV